MERRSYNSNWQNAYQSQNGSSSYGLNPQNPYRSTRLPLYAGSVQGWIMPSLLDRPAASIPISQFQGVTNSQLDAATSIMPSRLDAPQDYQSQSHTNFNRQAYGANLTQLPQSRQSPSLMFGNQQYNSAAGPSYAQQPTSLADHIHKIATARQLNYNSLSHSEKLEQESWAQEQCKRAGACVANYPWRRQRNGYRCEGTNHYITDELLASGNGGFYQRSDWKIPGVVEMWRGPVYDLNSSMHSTLPLVPGPQLGIPDENDFSGGLGGLQLNDGRRRRGGNSPQMVQYNR
ncbi:hypothetical protein BJ875DRAFT_528555 [Amylocarpus encephaloides]|uniref:Uncharacterized protein n=1 Tax=Amylocarpus encephaloides TaxID=45428 RepID=A0A9P7YMC2_9HELO|nr:hypothetical protein BJ875DRAFT_528555 [Amylocarpus encephaloides]